MSIKNLVMTKQVYSMLLDTTRMFAIWGGLFAWHWGADKLGCLASALLIIPLWVILTLAMSELALLKRHTFVTQYLRSQGVLARLLRRSTILLLRQAGKALFFSLVLIISALFFSMNQWLVLLADILLMVILVQLISRLLSNEVKPNYRAFLARYWAHWVNAIILWLTSVLVIFYSSHNNYLGMSWEQVVHVSASKMVLGCDSLAVLARFNAVSEALTWWAAQNFLNTLVQPAQVLMAWFAFSALFGISFLIAWAYSRALAGALLRSWWLVTPNRLPTDNG
jgi:hypothetical protein